MLTEQARKVYTPSRRGVPKRGSCLSLRVPVIAKVLGLFVVLACLVAGGMAFYRPLLQEKTRLERIRDAYRGDNEAMAAQITDLKQKQVLFASDPDFVEKVARSANRVRPNEVIFVFPRDK